MATTLPGHGDRKGRHYYKRKQAKSVV